MTRSRHASYLESRVLTAPSHQLHLLLIEGAIRIGTQAEAALRRGDVETADAPLMRTIDILGEMLAGVRETKTDLNTKIATFYLYVFRRVSEAKVNDDVEALAEALELLEYERQTWQLVCEKLAAEGTSGAAKTHPPRSGVARSPQLAPPFDVEGLPSATHGLSLEA